MDIVLQETVHRGSCALIVAICSSALVFSELISLYKFCLFTENKIKQKKIDSPSPVV